MAIRTVVASCWLTAIVIYTRDLKFGWSRCLLVHMVPSSKWTNMIISKCDSAILADTNSFDIYVTTIFIDNKLKFICITAGPAVYYSILYII